MWNRNSKSLLPAVLLCALRALAGGGEPQRLEAARPCMGTLFQITVYSEDIAAAQRAVAQAFARAAELDARLSDYQPDSELNLLCRAGGSPQVSEDLFRVLTLAQRMARETGGAFDVTLGPLIQLWREARKTAMLPRKPALDAARRRCGFRKLRLRQRGGRRIVELARRDMRLDLGGIAKGYAADEMLRTLREAGFPSALVAASGDLAIGDAPPGRPSGWRIQLAETGEVRDLARAGVSTSGDESQFVVIEGARYSHIVDPATGIGLRDSSMVSVVAASAMEADARATALSVLQSRAGGRTRPKASGRP